MIGTSKSSGAKLAGAIVLGLAILVWSGCGGGLGAAGSDAKSEGMTVTPSNVTLRSGDTTQFTAQLSGSTGSMNQTVTWYVNGVRARECDRWQHRPNRKIPGARQPSHAAFGHHQSHQRGRQNPFCHQFRELCRIRFQCCRSLSPTFLPVGNFSLNVGGAGFVSGSKVMFGGTALATTYVGPTQLTATGTTTSGTSRNGQDHGRES